MRRCLAALLAAAASAAAAATGTPSAEAAAAAARLHVVEPEALGAGNLALIVNDADPDSVAAAGYYAAQRRIAPANVLHVRFARAATLDLEEFRRVKEEVDARMGPSIQLLALAWTLPYRVGCMSVTSAFALGFDPAWCAEGCHPTRRSPYFDSSSRAPWNDLGLRPAMLLAGSSVEAVRHLVDRGVGADATWPEGTGYLLSTSDVKRNVRAATYPAIEQRLGNAYALRTLQADHLEHRSDVMFYFTGVQRVEGMGTNRFLDGAVADHLTSFGGVLDGTSQTTVLDWLDAGATGSYGTVVEPCAFVGKFPHAGVVIEHYLAGETLVEAYWKSVLMPGQGLFAGDPLARPFGRMRIVVVAGGQLRLVTRFLAKGGYVVQLANAPMGPYRTVGAWTQATNGMAQVPLPSGAKGYVRLVAERP
jgi:uncharacterized protein (TIGR03790 family)